LKRFAERYFRLASEYAGQAKPPRPVFQLELGQAVYYNTIANFKKSLKHGLRAVEIAQDTGALREWGSAMLLVTWAHYALGNLVKGRNTGIEMIRVGEEGGDQQVVVWGLNGSGTWRKRLGQIDEAIHSFLRAEKIAKELPNYSDQVTAGAWLGRCYLNKGDLEQALSIFANCQEISLSKGAVAATVYLGNGFIEAYLSGAEKASGEEKQEWLRKAKRVLLITIKDSKRNQSTFPDTLLLQGRYEWLSGKQRAANKWWSRALKLAELTQDRYYEGIIHLEIGKRLEDRQHLRKAESILEGIDAAFDMEAARNAISSLPESNMDY